MAIDKEEVEFLSKSRKILGELYPIIVDKTGVILVGKHRAQAGWTSKKEIDLKDIARALNLPETEDGLTLASLILTLHSNIQRRPTKKETRETLTEMAKIMERMGVPKEKICSELSKLLPYSDRYIRELLPEEYKMESKARFAELTPQIAPTELREGVEAVAETRPVRTKEELRKVMETIPAHPISEIFDEVPCPYCGKTLRVYWLERRIEKPNGN
ncbi:MAG: hypothetical protein QXH03_10960 [Candidatus Bathyarchaeia archaeon]